MENLPIISIVMCASGLLGSGSVEGVTGGRSVTVTCTNESDSENQIQLLCNLETFFCSSMDGNQEKFTIDPSSIQLPGKVFRARGGGAPNSPPANYSCQSEDGVTASTVFSTVPDPNTTTVPASPPGTISWNNQPTEPKEDLESHVQKEKRKHQQQPGNSHRNGNKNPNKNCDKNPNKKGCPNEGSRAGEDGVGEGGKREDRNRRGEAEEGDGKDLDKRPDNGSAPLYTAITTFAVIAALTVILLLLAAFCLHLWKKRIQQSTSKAGGASAQKLQEGDCEKKVVTVNAEATNSGNPVLPPVYNPTGHIYQEIADTPQNSAEDRHNPLYVPSQ